MKLSKYVKIYRSDLRSDYRLLFSTKRVSKVEVPLETLEAIEQGTPSPEDEALLSKLGMIVEDREEEKRSVFGVLDRMNAKSTELNITVVLNLDCNFACIYCYQGNMKGPLYMTDETADYLMAFIKDRFSDQKESLVVDFYGGEPLLSLNLIKSISKRLKSFAKQKKASYAFNLVTNGSLFTRKVAEDLVPLGLSHVQITLDGPAENHNKYRPFKSGAGSFDVLIKNMQETWDLAKIGIVGNFDKKNYRQFFRLLDDLEWALLTPEKISSIRFSAIVNRPKGDISPTDYKAGCVSSNEKWLLEAEALLRGEILRRGHHTPKVGPIFCMVESTDSFVVHFDGVIYKCPGFIGKPGFEVGDVQSGVRDVDTIYNIGMWKTGDCADCEYLPLCFGGCRYMAFIKEGNVHTLDCRKDYFDASLETLIKQDIRYGQPPTHGELYPPPSPFIQAQIRH
jgi:uncharacterized protein